VGEKTLFANYIQLEARCEKPILKGQISTRNNRIAELLQNPEKARFLLECSAIKTKIRNYFQTQAGFAEMETGILQPRFHAGLAKPFTTRSNALDQTLFLRLTSEVRLRAMLAIGIDRVMEIGPSFRNEGISNIYNPEFTLFEAYAARMPHEELMRLFENAVQYGLFEI
jgi:lysyl-tRNA synthetase class 2